VVAFNSESPQYSTCKYAVTVMDWKGRGRMTRARGVGRTSSSEPRRSLEGARFAFSEVARRAMRTNQKEGTVDMVIKPDNPDWLSFPVRELLQSQFTLMWTCLCPHYILKENKWPNRAA
jgi:hypothetical protein